MPVTVEVPEHGVVEFPDGMNQEQMEAAIRDRFSPKQPEPDSRFEVIQEQVPASGEERAARDLVLARRAGMPIGGGEHLPEALQSPAAAINAAMTAVGRAATGVANLPSRIHNALQPYGERSASYVPLLEADKPKVVIPKIQPEQMEGESKATQVAAGVYNKLAEFGTGLTTPGVGLTMAVLPAGIAKVAFGTQIAANIPGTIQESAKTLRDPSASLMEKGGAAAAPLAEAWMLKTIIKAAPVLPNAARAAAEAIGKETLKKGAKDAIPKRSPETLPVGQSPGDSPPLEQGAPAPEAPAQAQAQTQAAQPVRLSAEHQQLLDMEKASVDVPVETTAELDPNNAPFAQAKAGQIATIDRQRGTIVIDPAQFAGWLNEDMAKLSPEQKRLAVRSMLAEERNHLATSAEDAGDYWNSLSAAEKALEQKLYTGSFKGRGDVSGTDLGFEAIRRRFQQLARMDSTEVAQRAGAERWGYKSLEVLNSAIRGIRETLGTKASKEGLAILDKVQGNLDAARAVAGAGAPAALRKKSTQAEDEMVAKVLDDLEAQRLALMKLGDEDRAIETQNEIESLTRSYPGALEKSFPAALRKKRTTEGQEFFYLPPVKEAIERPAATDVGAQEYTTKKQLAPHAIGFDEAKGAAFRPITEAEAKSPLALNSFLAEGGRTGGSKARESLTHRVTALFDKISGRVDVVSTYRAGNEVKIADPTLLSRELERPHRPLEKVLDRYTPIYSIYLTKPVQNFHERYASMEHFQNEFGTPARELAASKLGSGAVSGIPATEAVRPDYAKPPSEGDVGALYDTFRPHTGKSAEDMRRAVSRSARAVSRQALTALDAMMKREMVANHNLSAEEAIEASLDKIYEDINAGQTRAEFSQRTLGRFTPQAAKAAGQPQATTPEGPPASQTARELTLPRFARRGQPAQPGAQPAPITEGQPGVSAPPEMLSPEERQFVKEHTARALAQQEGVGPRHPAVLYRQLGQRQAPKERYNLGMEKSLEQQEAEQQGELPGTEEEPPEPAALRPLREAKERTLAEAERVYRGISTLVNRRDIKESIPAARDAADTSANNLARQAENDVRAFANLSAKTPRAPKEVLNGLMPMVTSHAITADYDLNYATPEGRQLFLTMTYRDPKWQKATRQRMSPDPKEVAEGIWAQQRMKANAYGHLIASRDLRVENARYGFEDSAKDQLDGYMAKIDAGAAKLRAKRATGGWLDKWQAGHDLKVLQKMREDLLWVKNNWSNADLRSGALEMRKQLDFRYQREADNGYNLRYDQDYVPGRYEGELFNDQAILFPGIRILGRQWRQAKTFDTMYDAAEAGYVPVTRDGANIVGHRARQGERSIQYKQWTENLKNITDPVSGLPIAAKAKRGPDGRLRPPSNEYKLMTLRPGDDPVAVHEAYERLVDQMTAQSRITDFAPARIVLELEQRLKHTLLVGDFFHLGRLSYYAASIMGRKAGFKGGLAALDYSERALPEAVRQGRVTQREADYVNDQIPVKQGAATIMRSRRELAGDLQQQGLNVGQIQDALYKDLVNSTPLIGPLLEKTVSRYNKWLFDSYTRGLMMESALHEFERLNKSRPDIDSKVLMRDIARDTNRFYGSIGRQGWFKSRTWQDISRLAFLAPQWVEGLVMKEAGFAKRTVGAGLRGVGLPGGREGLPAMGTIGKGVGTGLLAMLVLTQAINLAFRRKPTWENEEDGHKWDAWIPGGDHGFFLSPLSVFNELTHDLVRYGETKPKAWDAVEQIGQNKLSPFGRLALVLATSKSPTGEYQTTTKGVLGKAAEQLAPAPISFGKVAREVGHAIAPGVVAPNAPGVLQRQGMQWAGLKAEPAGSASQRVSVMARKFMEANRLGQTGFQFETTDQPSYVKLRAALRSGDLNGADKIMQDIGKSPTEIGKAMKNWAHRPWTGSKKSDNAFFGSLSDAEMNVVSEARLEKQQLLERFYDLLSR